MNIDHEPAPWCACQSQPGQFGPWHPYGDTDWCPPEGRVDFDQLMARPEIQTERWASLDNGSGEVAWAFQVPERAPLGHASER